MIKFFRRIRQRLLSENKVSKYLLYAIGEIVLVVIGILIALQINNWNNERINRIEEKEYLHRIVMNLERDTANLLSSSKRHEERLVLGVQMLDSLGSENLDIYRGGKVYRNTLKKDTAYTKLIPERGGRNFFNVLRINLFYKTDIAFQELVSTGKISIIKNQELKAAIQEHYLRISDIQNFQDRIAMTIQENFRDALNKNNISMYSRESCSEIIDRLTDTSGLIVALENHIAISEILLNTFIYDEPSILESTKRLIIQIKEELNNTP